MKQILEVRCSGLARIMQCAGILGFENLVQEESGLPAKEGTAAGRYLQYLLEGTAKETIPSHCENGILFDDDMKFYATEFAQEILAKAGSPVLCETRIDWQTRSGIVVRGQYDASYIKIIPDGNALLIDDLKYGWNIVDVKENWQLLGYAIGEVIRRGTAFDRIILRIHQPRPHHEDGPTREWVLTYPQLLEYKEKIEIRMEEIAAGFRGLATGKYCKYCPAAAEACTAFNRAAFHGIDYVLNDFHQDSVSEKELSFQLDLMSRISEVLTIKYKSLKDLAVNRIREGKIVPNYMTEESYGDRKWKSAVSPKAIETMTGIKIVKEEMLSPAQAEKMGVSKELVKTLVDRHFVGMKVVRKDANALGNKIFGNQNPNK